jgi:hypothetical protein
MYQCPLKVLGRTRKPNLAWFGVHAGMGMVSTTPLGPTVDLAQGRCAKGGDPPQVDPKYASWTGVNANPGLGGFLGRGGSCPESLKLYKP